MTTQPQLFLTLKNWLDIVIIYLAEKKRCTLSAQRFLQKYSELYFLFPTFTLLHLCNLHLLLEARKNFHANCKKHTQAHLSGSLQLKAHLADYMQMTAKVHLQAAVPVSINNAHVLRCRVRLKRSTKKHLYRPAYSTEFNSLWKGRSGGRSKKLFSESFNLFICTWYFHSSFIYIW